MDAEDVADAQRRHEDKCDERQVRIHKKIDDLERLVYIGVGLIVALQFAAPMLISWLGK